MKWTKSKKTKTNSTLCRYDCIHIHSHSSNSNNNIGTGQPFYWSHENTFVLFRLMLLFLWLLLFVCVTIVISNSPIRLSLMDNSDTYKWTLIETVYRTGRVNDKCIVQTLCGSHVKNLENVISVHGANRFQRKKKYPKIYCIQPTNAIFLVLC